MSGQRSWKLGALVACGVLSAAAPVLCEDAGQAGVPLKVAEALDALVQPRFLQHAGRFGMSRVFSPYGHERVSILTPVNPEEQRALTSLNSHNHDWSISFLRLPHPRGTYGASEHGNPFIFRGDTTKLRPALYPLGVRRETLSDPKAGGVPPRDGTVMGASPVVARLALDALPRLQAGEKVDVVGEKRHVAMRPVRAAKEACLGCHKGAKMGDTLGVMVYAVDRMPLAAPKP